MAGKKLAMQKQLEILRLKTQFKLTDRTIARALKCSRNTVKKVLEQQSNSQSITSTESVAIPEWIKSLGWNDLYKEYTRGTPLQVLWEENYSVGKIPVQYPGFWKQFTRRFPSLPDPTMVKRHLPGERVEIDYCDGIDIYNPATGEVVSTQLFIGVLCYSRYCFAEFTYSQKSIDFLNSHSRMFDFFGGVPSVATPDNLKSAVSKAHFYDPEKNPAYTRLAEHYNFAVVPARVRSPKDKAIVERTVQIFQRWFYHRVRKMTFTSLMELNQCLQEHLKIFHKKKHRILQRTREEMFLEEKPLLKLLPQIPYEVHTHHKATLHDDCHLQFEKNFYSAPWQLRKQRLDIWATDKVVEIWNNKERVAVHNRAYTHGKYITNRNHYPPQHQAYLEITPYYIRKKASEIGSCTLEVMEELFNGEYPLQHLRRAQGIVALAKKYSPQQLEDACKTALLFKKYQVPLIENLIRSGVGRKNNIVEYKVNRSPNQFLRGDSLFN
ncbi:MAG: IS21 family transposase [Oligoflexia bacterium]|nr:IS21 family transposase [Oligoflexia bacterium]